jgi:hypothetical protein
MNEISQLYIGIDFAIYQMGQTSHILWGMTEASLGGQVSPALFLTQIVH